MTHALLLGLALTVGAPRLKGPVRPESPPIEGEWELVEWLNEGVATPIADGSGVEFRADGKRLWRTGPNPPEERAFKVYPKTSPAAIDLIRPAAGGPPDVFPAIYKIDGSSLVLCIGMPGADRPTRFDAGPMTGRMLMTFQRVAKK